MISLSSKGLFSSPRDSFGGQLNLSGALIVTAGVSGGVWDSLPLGVLCKLCTGQNLTLCFRLRCLRLCFRWILCLFWVGSLIHRRQILGVVESFQRLDGVGRPGMSTTILSNFRRNFRFRRVTLPDPSTLTAYWSNCFTSITKPVRSHCSG